MKETPNTVVHGLVVQVRFMKHDCMIVLPVLPPDLFATRGKHVLHTFLYTHRTINENHQNLEDNE